MPEHDFDEQMSPDEVATRLSFKLGKPGERMSADEVATRLSFKLGDRS